MTTNTKQPSHRLFTVKGEGEQARWLEIGAAWVHKGNLGFTLILDALPTDGRVVMREIQIETGAQS